MNKDKELLQEIQSLYDKLSVEYQAVAGVNKSRVRLYRRRLHLTRLLKSLSRAHHDMTMMKLESEGGDA